MFFPCSTCCKKCTLCNDDFNRPSGDDLGGDWREELGSWELKDTVGIDQCLLENQDYPAIASLDAPCNPDAPPYSQIIDVEGTPTGFVNSSKASILWSPAAFVPSVHRLWLGYSIIGSGTIRGGIFLQVEYGTRGPVNTIVIRLGYRSGGPDVWITDELPIGNGFPSYIEGEDYNPTDQFHLLTLCWEPVDYYGGFRTAAFVKGTITTPTGTHYTLEGYSYEGDGRYPIIEAIEGVARWDDLKWSATSPDQPECGRCGECLFAYDATSAQDANTAAYSGAGGTLSRNITTGAVELTSTTATWLVDIPVRHRLEMNYAADWVGSSPTLTIKVGSVRLDITKSGSTQLVTPTINGSLQGGISAPLGTSGLIICFHQKAVTVSVYGTDDVEYVVPEPVGYTNLELTAGADKVSITGPRVTRTSDDAVIYLGCQKCEQGGEDLCAKCDSRPAEVFPYVLVNSPLDFTRDPLAACTSGPFTAVIPADQPPNLLLAEAMNPSSSPCQWEYDSFFYSPAVVGGVPYTRIIVTVDATQPTGVLVSIGIRNGIGLTSGGINCLAYYRTTADRCDGNTFTLSQYFPTFPFPPTVTECGCVDPGDSFHTIFPATITVEFLA